MKRFILFWLLSSFFAAPPSLAIGNALLVMAVNEIISLPTSRKDAIHLEKRDLLAVKDNGTQILLHAKKEGTTILKAGSRVFKVVIMKNPNVNNYLALQSITRRMPGISLDCIDGIFRVQGQLDHISSWVTIANHFLGNFRMEVETSQQNLTIIENQINERLKNAGHFPIRLLREPYPTVRVPTTMADSHQVTEILGHFGIAIKEDKRRIYSEPLIKVQVLLAELRKSYGQSIGIEWPYQLSAKVLPQGILPQGEDQQLLMNYFAKQGQGRILAHPLLVAKSGSEAEFFAGGEFPIKIKTKQNYSVTWKKYGIMLKIKPLADPDGKISLDIGTEVSSIDSGEKIDGIPALFTNTLSSHFDLNSSQTIALSGLMKKVDGESLKMWPGLGDIPILGSLFTSRDYQEDKTELLVLVTPMIIGPD